MHREIGYGTKFTNAGSLQEKDGARERGTSLEIFDVSYQRERLHEEQMAQQQRETEQRLRVEATRLAAQTSTQLNAEFHVTEHDASAEMDELNRIRMQEFAHKAEEATDAQKHIFVQDAREELRRRENASCTLVNNLESKLRTQSLEPFTKSSNF